MYVGVQDTLPYMHDNIVARQCVETHFAITPGLQKPYHRLCVSEDIVFKPRTDVDDTQRLVGQAYSHTYMTTSLSQLV